MSKEERRAANLAAARANQQKAADQLKAAKPPVPPAPPIIPPAVPPAPPTHAEVSAAAADPTPPTQAELDEVAAFEAEQAQQIKDGETSEQIAAQESVQEGRDAVDAKRPLTSDTHVEDLDKRTDAQKRQDAALLERALADEAAGKGEKREAKKDAGVVLVHNTAGRVFGIALPAHPGEKRNQATHSQVQLLPGVNPVSIVDWREAEKQKMVQVHIEIGDFVVLDAHSIVDLADRKALELIDLTANKKLLLLWADQEKRPKVRSALAAQLEKIAPTKPKKDSDEDDEDDQE